MSRTIEEVRLECLRLANVNGRTPRQVAKAATLYELFIQHGYEGYNDELKARAEKLGYNDEK